MLYPVQAVRQMEKKETVDHRGELIMKKSRYSLALHPESW